MNDIELREYFNRIYNNAAQMSICIYAIMKNNDNTAYQLDIDESALSGLKTMFIKSLRNTIVDELQILNLSTADERRNAIFVYDMDIPPELTIMQQILNNDDFSLLIYQITIYLILNHYVLKLGIAIFKLFYIKF